MHLHRPKPERTSPRPYPVALASGVRLRLAVLAATAALSLPAPSLAQDPPSPDGSSRAIPQQADQCKDISTSIQNHVKTIKSLQAENEKDEAKLARSVSGVFRQLTGDPYVSPQAVKNSARIETEKRLSYDLASVLTSLKCPPVDVDGLIGPAPSPKR